MNNGIRMFSTSQLCLCCAMQLSLLLKKGMALHSVFICISLLTLKCFHVYEHKDTPESKTSYRLTNFCFIAEMKMMTQENIVSSKQ